MLTLAMMAFFYISTPVNILLAVIWKRDTWLNIFIRVYFVLMSALGAYVIFKVLG